MEKEKLDIITTIRNICSKKDKSDDYFYLLNEIFKHISIHENEPEDQQAQSVKRIIDDIIEGV